MRDLVRKFALLSTCLLLWACASSVPPSRMIDYVPMGQDSEAGSLLQVAKTPLQAGLVLVSDAAAPEAAPNLPDEALAKLGDELKQEIGWVLPVIFKEVILAEEIKPSNESHVQFADLAKRHGLDYLALVVVSSTEQEYPVSLFLGGTTHMQPGYRRDNWSLLEFALLDVHGGNVMMREEGRGWATLDRPTAPSINQWYPVVYLRPQDPDRRFWPPTYGGAPNTLRVLSFSQAAKRLTLKLQKSWWGRIEADAAVRRSG